MTAQLTHQAARSEASTGAARPSLTLAAALLGFFIVTLDAVVVNVALPTVQQDFGGGIGGLQWVVDGYTLMFAAFLLTSGVLSDRVGSRRAFAGGVVVFTLASLACGLAPGIGALVAARFVQGTAAAVMMPSSMALLGQAYADPRERARAVALWAMGGALASSSGPILGGLLTELSWRLIFLINVPVGVLTLLLVRKIAPSTRRAASIDWVGQTTAVVAMGGLTYGAVEAGSQGFAHASVLSAFGLAVVGILGFALSQTRGRHPMIPRTLLANRTLRGAAVIGFAFMVAYYGLPFVFTLYFQQQRGLSALQTGALFLPMMLIGAALTPLSARLVERVGHRAPIAGGLILMAVGAVALALMPATAPLAAVSGLLILVGLGGPLVMPPATGVLLNSVHGHHTGTASGVFNTSRQIGGALAIAVFGALLADRSTFMHGARMSLVIAAVVTVIAAGVSLRLRSSEQMEASA
ncbi:drug resistance transporter, EmrB/QacA subfamily [Jatrophihabitans endophyticus]|uniref:Drug resistance transporter, EmrB/QacA subfamily n=1 Tax=Jatrophihabitans endophyticus TaxID=1206085 RepID=A0A1M5S042_9ACTN|nr:MFS transporter [Jatrophihabitans endophyticus]SHH31678.1 drug resistance transporter, EmrB/QacA subfamily [Jatrophihabitans endophyticus]